MEATSSEPVGEPRIFFPVDTRDHCFLCLVKLTPQSGSDGSSCHSYYPLQYLSRYLKMNMRRLNEKGPFPPQRSSASLEPEGNCKWAVPLCEDCSRVNDQFLELKRQLEKIELEVANCLQRMHRKLEGSEESRTNEELRKTNEFVWELREEVMDKCSRKLCSVLLNNVQVPTAEGVTAEKYKSRTDSHITTVRVEKVKVVPNSHPKPVDSQGQRTLEDEEDDDVVIKTEFEDEASEEDSNYEDPLSEVEGDTSGDGDADANELEDDQDQNDEDDGELVEEVDKTSASASLIVIRPARSLHEIMKPPGVINPVTGKFTCAICPQDAPEFVNETIFHGHHQSIHLHIRYKCGAPDCGKIFKQRASFDRHFKVVHKGTAKVSCLGCNKSFSQNSAMRRHQRKTGCGKDIKPPPKPTPKCRICGREFGSNADAKKHLENVHLKLRRHQCDQCGKKFSQNSTLLRHRLRFHEGMPRKSS